MRLKSVSVYFVVLQLTGKGRGSTCFDELNYGTSSKSKCLSNWNTQFFYHFLPYIRMWKKNKNEKTVDI